MAIVERFIASLQTGDSAKKLRSTSQYVSATDAKAYVAAADQAARAATKVGLLLDSFQDMTDSEATNYYKKYGLECQYINDAFAFPPANDDLYNSNRFKVQYQTTNNGIPTTESMYVYMRATDVVMESDGIHVLLTDTKPANLVAQLLDTGLSSFGTAITAVNEITVDDI